MDPLILEPQNTPRLLNSTLITALAMGTPPLSTMAFGITHHRDSHCTAFLVHEEWPDRHCVHSLTEHQDNAKAAMEALYVEYKDRHPGVAWLLDCVRYGPDTPSLSATISEATPPLPRPRHRRRRDP